MRLTFFSTILSLALVGARLTNTGSISDPTPKRTLTADCSDSSSSDSSSDDYAPKNVQAAWDNQFAAFGGQDLDRILLNYDENSIVVTYDQTKDEKNTYRGVEGARSVMMILFEMLTDLSDLSAPVVDVFEDSKMVFLIWRNPASGILDSTDTFVFSDDNKIYRQNVVFRTD